MIKALIFDLDGTAVLSERDALPSSAVIRAVHEAKKYIKVACATGRNASSAKRVIESLGLTSPCIVSGGSQIVDPISLSPVWEVLLSKEKIEEVLEKIKHLNFYVRGSTDTSKSFAQDYQTSITQPAFFLMGLSSEDVLAANEVLQTIGEINFHTSTSWEPNKMAIQITHPQASKKHALERWLDVEIIDKEDVMAIGDADNDRPLFEGASVKVAMGNASEELMKLADWVAPTVTEDGVAAAIKKFILEGR